MLTKKELEKKTKAELIDYIKGIQGSLTKAGDKQQEMSDKVARFDDMAAQLEAAKRYHQIATDENSKMKSEYAEKYMRFDSAYSDLESEVKYLRTQNRKLVDIAAAIAWRAFDND